MKNKLLRIIGDINSYLKMGEELKKIDELKNEIIVNSDYNKKVREIVGKLYNEGIYIDIDLLLNKPFNEAIEIVETKVKEKKDVPLDYEESDLIEYYNGLNEEDKSKYQSYEDFKQKVLADFKKEQDMAKERINNLVYQLKGLGQYYEKMNQDLQMLSDRRKTLIDERWSMHENKLNNLDAKLLENGFDSKNGFIVINGDMPLVKNEPKLNENNFSIDDIVMVHATRYFPINGVVRSRKESTGDLRNTIHTALNGKVGSHLYGNWDDCPLIILDPLREHIDQVECIYSVDTYTFGSMKLSDEAIILIDADRFDEFYSNNKEYIDNNKDRVVLYSGDSTIVVSNLLSILGYAPEKVDQWGWNNKHDNDILNNFVQTNYPNKLNTAHTFTPHYEVENNKTRQKVLYSFGIMDNGEEMIITPEILYELRLQNKDLSTKDFIINTGVFVKDNEIHLLGTKNRIELLKTKNVSDFQIQKIDLLIKKYELTMELQNKDDSRNQSR